MPSNDDGAVFPTYEWGSAPAGVLATRRQLRALRLRPGGNEPVAQLRCRRCLGLTRVCTRMAWLYRVDLALPVRPMTPAKAAALDRAMAARQTCPSCLRRYTFALPLKTLGSCLECHDGTPADPAHYAPQPDRPKE
ncbi:RRQRL motif-containing zinc-binding protein [Actinacidiphila glaucinigra]